MQISSISSANFRGFRDLIETLAESYLNTPEKIIEDVKMEGERIRLEMADDDLDTADTFERASQRIGSNVEKMATTVDKTERMSLLDKIKNDLRIMNRDRSEYGKTDD